MAGIGVCVGASAVTVAVGGMFVIVGGEVGGAVSEPRTPELNSAVITRSGVGGLGVVDISTGKLHAKVVIAKMIPSAVRENFFMGGLLLLVSFIIV